MAKLAPKDPQFGIPVASRIDEDMAFSMNKEALKAGKTLSLYISEYLKKAAGFEKKIAELQVQLSKEKELNEAQKKKIAELTKQLANEKEFAKKVAGTFIIELSEGDKSHATQLIKTYNTILKDEQSNRKH